MIIFSQMHERSYPFPLRWTSIERPHTQTSECFFSSLTPSAWPIIPNQMNHTMKNTSPITLGFHTLLIHYAPNHLTPLVCPLWLYLLSCHPIVSWSPTWFSNHPLFILWCFFLSMSFFPHALRILTPTLFSHAKHHHVSHYIPLVSSFLSPDTS